MSTAGRPRAVFDCMVFLQASTRPTGPVARLLVDFVEARLLVRYVSDEIIAEVRDVLGRPRIRAKNPAVTDESVAEFCSRVEQVAQTIEYVPTSFTLSRDPDDEPYLNLAIAVTADYLVTRDNDRLDLMDDVAFRARFPILTILDPVALLRLLNQQAPAPKHTWRFYAPFAIYLAGRRWSNQRAMSSKTCSRPSSFKGSCSIRG